LYGFEASHQRDGNVPSARDEVRDEDDLGTRKDDRSGDFRVAVGLVADRDPEGHSVGPEDPTPAARHVRRLLRWVDLGLDLLAEPGSATIEDDRDDLATRGGRSLGSHHRHDSSPTGGIGDAAKGFIELILCHVRDVSRLDAMTG